MKKVMKKILIVGLVAFAIAMQVASCVSSPADKQYAIEKITYQQGNDAEKAVTFKGMINDLAKQKVVLIGEQHTRLDHHLTQLAILKALHKRNPDIAIGAEWFQQGFQAVLDDFIAGNIDENTMLRRSEYYTRWKYDYRLYKPILDYARKHKIPVLALNAPIELTSKIGEKGLQALTPAERQQLPAVINPPTEKYQNELKAIFQQHHLPANRIQNFITVQRVWDETMAANSIKYLQANPQAQLIIMAGSGHIAHDAGIGNDISRQLPTLPIARVASLDGEKSDSHVPLEAEYLIQSYPVNLPPTGKMGVMLNTDNNQLTISQVKKDGGADAAGLQAGDVILKVNGENTPTMTDLKLLIGTASVGQEADVLVQRGKEQIAAQVTLK
jgi:uncharacterized iron-regulated protein